LKGFSFLLQDELPTESVVIEKDVKFRERYESPKQNRNLPFWKSCLSENASDRSQTRGRRSLSADDSASVRSALIEHKSEGNLSPHNAKSDAKKKKKKQRNTDAEKSAGRTEPADDAQVPAYFSPSRFEGNWSECANALGAAGHYHTMPNPTRHDIPGFSKRLFGSGRVGGPPPIPPGPPSFLPDGSLLTVYDSRRLPIGIRPPLQSPHHHHHHHPFHHQYPPLYQRSVGECYYTPPQTEYYQRQPPPPHIHVHVPQRHFWQEPPVDYSRTLGRTRREAPLSLQNNHSHTSTKPEMSKLKRLMFARAAAANNSNQNNNGSGGNKEELKMCTWSPYTSYDVPDYSTPLRMTEKVKPPQKSLDELRF